LEQPLSLTFKINQIQRRQPLILTIQMISMRQPQYEFILPYVQQLISPAEFFPALPKEKLATSHQQPLLLFLFYGSQLHPSHQTTINDM